jgi:hypothetical protein
MPYGQARTQSPQWMQAVVTEIMGMVHHPFSDIQQLLFMQLTFAIIKHPGKPYNQQDNESVA